MQRKKYLNDFSFRYFRVNLLSVLDLDDVSRADIGAMSALHALGDIDLSQVVNNDDRICGALTLTLHAADAADVADLARDGALVLILSLIHI